MKLVDIDLLKLQAGFMRDDASTKALSSAIGPQLQAIASQVGRCLILPDVDQLPEEVLDQLAYELHVDWYSTDEPIEVKRNLIKNSDMVHMYMGTPYALEQVVIDYLKDGRVVEWFDYGGQPGYFKVQTTNPLATGASNEKLVRAIEMVKRRSSRLEAIEVLLIVCGNDNPPGIYGSICSDATYMY